MKPETPDRTALAPMHARDVMTTEVVTVGPDEPIPGVAHVLLANGISAVPVIDRDGVPIGMVSDGDLIGRDETEPWPGARAAPFGADLRLAGKGLPRARRRPAGHDHGKPYRRTGRTSNAWSSERHGPKGETYRE